MNCCKLFFMLLFPATFFSCHSGSQSREEPGDPASDSPNVKMSLAYDSVKVNTSVITLSGFQGVLYFNGQASAFRKIDIQFPASEMITGLTIANGIKVSKGQLLASLDETALQRKMVKNRESLEKSLVDLDDKLIDYGYRLKDSARIPREIFRMARIRSGYQGALSEQKDLEYEIARYKILAPAPGRIADMEATTYNLSSNYRKLCTIIQDDSMQVNFMLIGTEGRFVRSGALVMVSAEGDSSGREYKGIVTHINPRIDENGMIRAQALVVNRNGLLMDGMHVTIKLIKEMNNQLVVPKQALVKRQGRNVIFTLVNGRAKWNYVDVLSENAGKVVIRGVIRPGDSIILEGNENLANDTPVSVVL